jgi:hypothetical protein
MAYNKDFINVTKITAIIYFLIFHTCTFKTTYELRVFFFYTCVKISDSRSAATCFVQLALDIFAVMLPRVIHGWQS